MGWFALRLIDQDLWGVDDPSELASIRRKCLYASNTLGAVGLCLLLLSVCLGVLGGAVSELLPGLRFGAWLIPGALGVPILSWYWRRSARRELPHVLRSMNRCVTCGYDLSECSASKCPECGQDPNYGDAAKAPE